jgi:hypothetical protein
LNIVFAVGNQLPLILDDALRGKRAVELRLDIVEHALLLSLCVGRGDLRPLRPFSAAQTQLAAGDDLLRDIAALQLARGAIDANLFTDVADHGIEGQPRLIRCSLLSLELGIRLDERRIVGQCHPLQILQSQRRRLIGRHDGRDDRFGMRMRPRDFAGIVSADGSVNPPTTRSSSDSVCRNDASRRRCITS